MDVCKRERERDAEERENGKWKTRAAQNQSWKKPLARNHPECMESIVSERIYVYIFVYAFNEA
jgi:hypothetical protein